MWGDLAMDPACSWAAAAAAAAAAVLSQRRGLSREYDLALGCHLPVILQEESSEVGDSLLLRKDRYGLR